MIFNPIIFGSEETVKLNPSAVPAAAQSLFADVIKVAIDDASEGNAVKNTSTGKSETKTSGEDLNASQAAGAVALLFNRSQLLPEYQESTATGVTGSFTSTPEGTTTISTAVNVPTAQDGLISLLPLQGLTGSVATEESNGKLDLSLLGDIEKTKIETENLLKELKINAVAEPDHSSMPVDDFMFAGMESSSEKPKPVTILSAPAQENVLKNKIIQNTFPRSTNDFLDDIIKDIKTFRLNTTVTSGKMPVQFTETVSNAAVTFSLPGTGTEKNTTGTTVADMNPESNTAAETNTTAAVNTKTITASGTDVKLTSDENSAVVSGNKDSGEKLNVQNKTAETKEEQSSSTNARPVNSATPGSSKETNTHTPETAQLKSEQINTGAADNSSENAAGNTNGKTEAAATGNKEEAAAENSTAFEKALQPELNTSKETPAIKTSAQEFAKEITKEQTLAKTRTLTPAEVVKELQTATAKKETGTLQLQLTPEHLGKIELKITQSGGLIKAAVSVENEQAKQALEQSLQQLHKTTPELSQNNLTVHISVASDQQQKQKSLPQKKRNVKQEEFTTEDVTTQTARKLGYNTYEFVA